MNARIVVTFACGLVFALGLGLSGMTHPHRILGFLDVFGTWDPTLMFTMMGAIGIHLPLSHWIRRRSAPVLDTAFHLPAKRDLDAPLIIGSALFGIGWALGGFCPGPAMVSVLGGHRDNALFFGALLAGMALHGWFARIRGRASVARGPSSLATGSPSVSG